MQLSSRSQLRSASIGTTCLARARGLAERLPALRTPAALAALVTVLALPVPAGAVAAPAAGPQPLTAAERQGVQLAAQYMVGGAAAWWPELARGSWLRALGQDAASAEIETRGGAPSRAPLTVQAAPASLSVHGAAFTLEFPSGADDTLL